MNDHQQNPPPSTEDDKNNPETPDKNEGWLTRERASALALLAATAVALYVCYRLSVPFIPAITWALALAVVAFPVHARILRLIGRPNPAAGLTVLIAALVITLPAVFLGQVLVSRVSKGAQSLKEQSAAEQWEKTIESNPQLGQIIKRVEPYVDVRSAAEKAADAASSHATTFVGGLLWVAAQLVITFFTLFYLFRDRLLILKAVRSLMPLSQSETDRLFHRVGNTIYATIYGTFSVSLAQGVLGGLMFWWLGLPAPLLWGTVMFLLSLIPVLGAPVVWIPAALYLALTGESWKALILFGWGAVVIGSVDNLIYPVLVGDKVRLHPLLVFFSVLGGLSLIGAAGLVLGPAAVVVTGMLIEVWRERTAGGGTIEEGIENKS